jgi:hypothetical protein
MAFKKGVVTNPKGRPKLKPHEKFHRAMTRVEFQQLAFKMLFSNREAFKKQLESPDATMLELAVGSVIKKGVQEGSERHLNFLLEQTIGKVKENIHIEVEGKLTAEKLRPEDIRKILAADPFFAAQTIEVESGNRLQETGRRTRRSQPAVNAEGTGTEGPKRGSGDDVGSLSQRIGTDDQDPSGRDRASEDYASGTKRLQSQDQGTSGRSVGPSQSEGDQDQYPREGEREVRSGTPEDTALGDDGYETPDGEGHSGGDDEDLGEPW